MGQTLTVDAQMQLASLKENVTVTAESPVVDTESTAVGNTMNTAKLIGVPSSSDLWGALAQSPGVRMQGFDVGGSHKVQQSGYSAFGISGQTRIVTEGVDTTEGTGGAGFYQDYYSQNEVSVSGAGQDVSMNTPGAAVISTIKSGGNTFKSLINQTYEGKSFVGDNTNSTITSRGGSASPNLLFWENHDDLGGPINRDKLWFFVAYNHFHIDKSSSGVDPNIATSLGIFNNFTTKETWKPTSHDTLIGYYQWAKKAEADARPVGHARSGFDAGRVQPELDVQRQVGARLVEPAVHRTERRQVRLRLPRAAARRLQDQSAAARPGDGGRHGRGLRPGRDDRPLHAVAREKPQVYGNATYYLPTKNAGSHDLKLGFEWLNDMSNFASSGTAGPILYLDNNGATDEIRLTDVGTPATLGSTWTVPGDNNKRVAFYRQDRWTANAQHDHYGRPALRPTRRRTTRRASAIRS